MKEMVRTIEINGEMVKVVNVYEVCPVDSYNLNVVRPWWCTTWENYEESKKAIKKAMAELRRKIKAIPCYSRYRKVA